MIMARLAVALLSIAGLALAGRYHGPRPTSHPKPVKPVEEHPSSLFWGNVNRVNSRPLTYPEVLRVLLGLSRHFRGFRPH